MRCIEILLFAIVCHTGTGRLTLTWDVLKYDSIDAMIFAARD